MGGIIIMVPYGFPYYGITWTQFLALWIMLRHCIMQTSPPNKQYWAVCNDLSCDISTCTMILSQYIHQFFKNWDTWPSQRAQPKPSIPIKPAESQSSSAYFLRRLQCCKVNPYIT